MLVFFAHVQTKKRKAWQDGFVEVVYRSGMAPRYVLKDDTGSRTLASDSVRPARELYPDDELEVIVQA